MATISDLISRPSQTRNLRPFDVRRDLSAVADLVELSFRDSLDAEGHRYLTQMRDAARNPGLLRWAGSVVEQVTLPLWGYVWETEGRLVGNLSLIPFSVGGRRRYLIANVAVHPNYRRQGIGQALTTRAIDHARQRGAEAAWLHVREENEAAVHLYQSLGFVERTRRSTWHAQRLREAAGGEQSASDYLIGPRLAQDWPLQRSWLQRLYPPDLAWHIPLNPGSLQPGISGLIQRIFNGSWMRQWSIQRDGKLLGAAALKNSAGALSPLWLALPAEFDEAAVQALLVHTRRRVRRTLAIDFPGGFASPAIRAAGFQLHQTLIWMSVSF